MATLDSSAEYARDHERRLAHAILAVGWHNEERLRAYSDHDICRLYENRIHRWEHD